LRLVQVILGYHLARSAVDCSERMDFNTAMAVAAKAEADGDDVAADSMRAAIKEQDANIKAAAEHNSEHEDWLRKIDVPYINACTDVEELHKISQYMEKEGFAGLKKAADERLRDFVKAAEKEVDMDALLADLNDWEMVAEQQDQELRQAASEGGEVDRPRIRRGVDPTVRPKEPEFVPMEKNKPEVIHATKEPGSGARHTYDNYQKKWDKWDNAEFIEDVLTEEAKKEEEEAKQQQERSKVAKPKVSDLVRQAPVKKGLNSVEKKIMADKEKEKGNECFKSGEYDTSIEYYTRGLALHETAIIYANRAMAYLRQDRPADAVKDCDSALRVDPSYKKALFRRGLAYKALKSWDEAADDLKAALSADPGSKQILKELTAVERGQAEARKNRFKRMAVEEVGDDKNPAAPAAAPKKTFKRITVEEDSDSDSDEESEEDTKPQQEAPPVAQTQPRRIVVEESSDDDESEEEAAPAKPAFTRVAVEEDSSDDDDSAEQEKAASPPPIASAPRRIVVEESSSEDDEEQAAEPVPAPPVEEECPEALKIKAEGNLHFKGGRYEQAIEAYTRSLELLPREDHPEAVKIYSNRAACHAQGGNHRQVVADCNAALALEPTAIKALMRRSHALESLEKFEPALDDMKTVLKLDWNIKEAQTARQRLESFVRAEHKMNGTIPKPKKEAWAEPAKAQAVAKQSEPTPKVGEQPKKRIVVEEDSSDDEEDDVAKKAEPAKTAPAPKVFEQPKRRIVVEEDSSDDEEEAAEKTEPLKKAAPAPKVVEQQKKRIVVEEDSDADSDDEDEITPEERVTNATKAKEQGNAAFKQRDFGEAVRLYTLAIECQCADTTLVSSLYNNRAMAQLKVGAAMPEGSLERFSSFKQALKDTTTVLKTEPDNVKALFRKGQAYMGLDEYEHAARELAEVVKLQPTNKAAKTELAQANAKLAQIKTVEAAMSQHLAGSDAGDDAPSSIVMPGTAKNQTKKAPMISEVDASADKNEKKSSKKKKGSKPMIIEEVATNKSSTSSAQSSPKSSPRGMPAPLQLGKPSVPSNPPVSSTAFEQQYNRLKKYPELFCDYLQLIKPETLPKLFRSSITADMLLAIVSCLSSEFLGKRDMAKETFKYMQNLSKINRLSTTLLAMTGGERAQLADLLDQLENIGGQAAGFAPSDIGPLRAVFA